MTTMIEYRNGEYAIRHDSRYWTEVDIENHFCENGHEREHVGFITSDIRIFRQMSEIAQRIEKVFDEKQERIPVRFRR